MSQSSRTERLINLLFILMAATRPVSRDSLREAITEYRDSKSDDAFERMFERDKEELRSMGIPVQSYAGEGKGGIDGYRVIGAEYELPDLDLNAEEMTLLTLAAQVWEQASLDVAARTALTKLLAVQADLDIDPPALIARVRDPEPAFAPLLAAIQSRRLATFDYRRPRVAQSHTRRLHPWGLIARKGYWYVVGHDLERDAPRVFRLSRVIGQVRVSGPERSYEIPPHDPAAMVTAESPGPAVVAAVQIRPGRAQSLRQRASIDEGVDWDTASVNFDGFDRAVRDLAGYGADVIVLDPPELVEAVRTSLRHSTKLAGV